MSWFTAEVTVSQPTCPRCKKPNFAVLVKRAEMHNIYDCRKCGIVVPKVKT